MYTGWNENFSSPRSNYPQYSLPPAPHLFEKKLVHLPEVDWLLIPKKEIIGALTKCLTGQHCTQMRATEMVSQM